jgi:hypothetical protein
MTFTKECFKIKPKVELLKKRNEENREIKRDVEKVEEEIFKVYSIVFKNFVSKRIDTKIELDEEQNRYWKYNICLNKDGFSLIGSYDTNSKYIHNFTNLLKSIKKHKSYEKLLTKTDSKKVLKKFAKELLKMKLFEFDLDLKLNFPKTISFEKDDLTPIYYIKLNENFSLDFNKNSFDLYFHNLDNLKEYMIVEHFNKEIIKLLNMQKKQLLRIKNERKKTLLKLREVFADKLIFDELRKEDN